MAAAQSPQTPMPPQSHSNASPLQLEDNSRASTIVDPEIGRPRGDDEDEDVNSEFEREAYGPPEGEKGVDPYEVRMGPQDPDNPKTWPRPYRWYITMLSAVLLLNAYVTSCFLNADFDKKTDPRTPRRTFSSSAPQGVIPDLIKHFGFGREVATLTIAIFVAGYCVGPLVWGPLSESVGRRPVFLASFVVYTGFQVGSALARNTASVLIFRFLGGMFAAAPLANSGYVILMLRDCGAY